MVELNQQLTTSQLIPQAAQEEERTRLLEKILDDFKAVCDTMDSVRKDTSQHVEDICQMKLEVSQMRGKASLKSHEAVSLWDMIQADQDTINQLIEVVKRLQSYNNSLGQIKVVRERLQVMDLRISELQMRPLTQVLEDRLARLEDRMQDQHKEIVILHGQICHCGQQGDPLVKLLISERLTKALVPPASPPVTSSSLEEEERSELDYTDDPPAPHVEGTARGTGCKVFMRLSVTDFSCDRLGWYSEQVPDSSPNTGVWFECIDSITR